MLPESYWRIASSSKRIVVGFVVALVLLTNPWLSAFAAEPDGARWTQWRGPSMDGSVAEGNPPIRWSETENIRFKIAIPGLGSGTPIVWGDTMYLLTAIPSDPGGETGQELEDWQRNGREIFSGETYVQSERKQRFTLMALDRQTGATRFAKTLIEAQPHEGIHPTNSWASASPVTDGERIYCFFGSQGLFATTMQGDVVWSVDLGDMTTRKGWGEGSTPAIHGDAIVVNWDHEGESFLAVLDKRSGNERWRVARDEVTTWFTPIIVEQGGRAQVITTGANRVRAYDLETGDIVWHGPGLTLNAIPTPIERDGKLYVTSGFRGEAMYAVDLARAVGDIEEAGAILWSYPNDTPYVASPLLYGDTLYYFKGLKGILTALDVRNGEPVFGPVRVPDLAMVYASPVGVAGRIYAPGREGNTVVFRHGDEFEVLAVNALDDVFDASPIVLGDDLYLRGREFLYRIAEAEKPAWREAAASDSREPGFPETWFGHWRGRLAIHDPSGSVQYAPMEMHIGPEVGDDRVRWTIVYGEGERRQERPYELVTVDATAQRYEVDEKNSIRIPSRFIGGNLLGRFEVGGSWIVSRYRVDRDRLTFELIVGSNEGTRTGGEGAVPVVLGFPVDAYHQAVLDRVDG